MICDFKLKQTIIGGRLNFLVLMWRRWSGLVNASRSRPLPFNCDTEWPSTIPFDHIVFGTRLKSGGKKKVDLSHLIPENELHEDFVFGSGPGGQAVNKTKNAVFLKHIPTGKLDGIMGR